MGDGGWQLDGPQWSGDCASVVACHILGEEEVVNASETVVSTPYLAVAIPTAGWLLPCMSDKLGGKLL